MNYSLKGALCNNLQEFTCNNFFFFNWHYVSGFQHSSEVPQSPFETYNAQFFCPCDILSVKLWWSVSVCVCNVTFVRVFLPGFQLRPTFSEQPPTNGVKTRLVKMCRGQHTAASLLLCVKTAIGRTGIEQFSTFVKKKKKTISHKVKDTSLLWELKGFSLCVCP